MSNLLTGKKILVTGGAGFIGCNLIRMLVAGKCKVLNFDKLTYAGNALSLVDLPENQYELFVADITDASAIEDAFQKFKPQAVMHLAAESHVDRSIDGPGEFIQTNVVGTLKMLEVATDYWRSLDDEAATRFRFHHISTDEVYGSLGDVGKFTEITPYDPHSPYSASKASSDHLVRAWNDTYGLPVLITNCSNNYGPYQFPEKLIPVVILKALRGEPIPVYGKGENVRDWLHVNDHCRALIEVVARGRVGETYNIGGDNEMRNIELVRLLCLILDELQPRSDGKRYSEQITFVTDRPGHDLRYAIDATKIQTELGWRPQFDRESGMWSTVQWYLDRNDWWQPILDGSYQLERLGRKSGSDSSTGESK